jgi:hypothetical protein
MYGTRISLGCSASAPLHLRGWTQRHVARLGVRMLGQRSVDHAGVNVLDRQRIGPFDVTRLAADDAVALAKWLAAVGGQAGAGRRWSQFIGQPDVIGGDYVFTAADTDTDFQMVVYVTRHRGDLTGLLVLVIAGVGIGAAIVLVARGATRRARPPA